VLGGRDPRRAAALAEQLGAQASAARVDLFDPRDLAAFVQRGEIVLNCAGPSDAIGDVVARAAIAGGRHLVDVGGDERTVGELAGRWDAASQRGVLLLIDAGWIPGVSGALARLVDERAAAALDRVERLDVFCGDRGAWSATGMMDVLAVARGLRGPGQFEQGVWRPLGGRAAVRRVRLPAPFGKRVGVSAHMGELRGISARDGRRPVRGHLVPMLGPRAALAFGLGVGPLRGNPARAAQLLAAGARADALRSGGGGVVAAVAHGVRDGRPAAVRGIVTTTDGQTITGRCAALAVATLARGEIDAAGCEYLCDVVAPAPLLDELHGPLLRYAITG
jgi:hypothetical protein